MTNDLERAEQRRALEEFANSDAQPNQPLALPQGNVLMRQTPPAPVGAQSVAVRRDTPRILQELSALAAAAGEDWTYRYPVKTAGGGQDWITGPSIKLANDVARIYGNCSIDVISEADVGDCWVFVIRFTDYEKGFSMERSYRAFKSTRSIRTKDIDRQQTNAYQAGLSKAIRNVICNSLQSYADYAFEQANASIVSKIGKNLEHWRELTLQRLADLNVPLPRVQRVIGRTPKEWRAPDIAKIASMMRAVNDGMATLDDTFPPDQTIIEKAPPAPVAAPASPAEPLAKEPVAAPASPAVATAESAEGGKSGSEVAPPAASYPTAPTNLDEYRGLFDATLAAATNGDELMKWFRSEAQRRLRNACGLVAEETAALRGAVDARVKELNA